MRVATLNRQPVVQDDLDDLPHRSRVVSLTQLLGGKAPSAVIFDKELATVCKCRSSAIETPPLSFGDTAAWDQRFDEIDKLLGRARSEHLLTVGALRHVFW